MCEYIILEDFMMDKYVFDNSNGFLYELSGDYYIPCLTSPAEEEKPTGIYGLKIVTNEYAVSFRMIIISRY